MIIKASFPLMAALFAYSASAQSVPELDPVNPRIQTAAWQAGETVDLIAMPRTSVSVIFELGEQVETIRLGEPGAFDVAISAGGDSIVVTPLRDDAASLMELTTDRRSYAFALRTANALTAAYVLRFDYGETKTPDAQPISIPASTLSAYKLKGDRELRPDQISDDGERTYLSWSEEKAIPAVFAIGTGGKEQVVNGHMRDDIFVIDRVHDELVFRIDKDKATAERRILDVSK